MTMAAARGLTRRSALALGGSALCVLYARAIAGPGQTEISVADYGALPNGSDATPGVRQAIARLPKQGGAILTFPPGAYHFAASTDFAFTLDGIHDLTINGSGAKLVFAGKTHPFFIKDCASPLVRGLSIDWGRPPFSQGEVIAVAADARSADVRIDPEFPVDGSETVQAIATYDRNTRLMAVKGLDAYNVVAEVSLVGTQLLRLSFTRPLPLKPGDTVVLRHQVHAANIFFITDCADVRLEDVTIHAGPGMALLGVNCRNATIERMTIVPPPGSNRLMTTCADGIHLSACSGVVEIRDCSMEGMGDDGVNVHGNYLHVVRRIDAKTAVVAQPGDIPFRPVELPPRGDQFVFVAGRTLGPLGDDQLSGVDSGANAVMHFADDIPASVGAGDLLFDRDNNPKLTVANCRFWGNRARGVLAHRNALIERCQFVHQFEEAILMLESTAGTEGPGVDHSIVRNNEILDSDRAGYPSGAIRLGALIQEPGLPARPSPAMVNHDDLIADNHIVMPGGNAIQAEATEGLTIENNWIERPAGAAIVLSNVRNTVVANNICAPAASVRIDAASEGEVILRGNSGLARP
jgi:parallel beta helix pectate lyase-like protein